MAEQVTQAQTPSTPASVSAPSMGGAAPKSIGDILPKTLGKQSKTQPEPVPTMDEMWATLAEKVDSMPDFSDTQGYDPYGEPVDLGNVDAQKATETANEALKTGSVAEAAQQPETQDGPLYQLKTKIGDEDVEFDFDTQEELDNMLTRGFQAGKVYQAYEKLKEENQSLSMAKEKLAAFDSLIENTPERAFDLIAEEMIANGKEEQIKQWIIRQADYLSKSAEEKAQIAKMRDYERTQEQLLAHQRAIQQIEAQKKQAIVESEFQQMQSWAQSSLAKYASKFPEDMKPWLQGTIRDLLALNRAQGNGDVSFEDLSRQLHAKLRPIMTSTQSKRVAAEVGKATDQRKAENLSKAQSVVSRGQPPTSNKTEGIDDFIRKGDAIGLSKFLTDSVNSGRLRINKDR
jgi:hypothetical protein